MRGENEGEVTRWTCGRKVADFGLAPAAQVATAGEVPMTRAQRCIFLDNA